MLQFFFCFHISEQYEHMLNGEL